MKNVEKLRELSLSLARRIHSRATVRLHQNIAMMTVNFRRLVGGDERFRVREGDDRGGISGLLLAAILCFVLAALVGSDETVTCILLSAVKTVTIAAVESRPFCAAAATVVLEALAERRRQFARAKTHSTSQGRAGSVRTALAAAALVSALVVMLGRNVVLAEFFLAAVTKICVAAVRSSAFCVAATTVTVRLLRR